MRIRWSDEAALEMLSRLNAAQDSLDGALKHCRNTDALFEEAFTEDKNANRAVAAMADRFSEWEGNLKKLQTSTLECASALRRAQELMDDAEGQAIQLANAMDTASMETSAHSQTQVYILPNRHTDDAFIPDWLNERADQFDIEQF